MSHKEKAEELVNKFNYEDKHYLMLDAKQCALIAVDELIKELGIECYENCGSQLFWKEVKQEIEKL